MSLLEKASLIVTPNAYKASKLYSVVPSSGAGDIDVVRATTATRVNAQGLIEEVGINIPRLDYTNGTCPSLLVEPQRTNLLTYSDDFSNGSWNKINTTITANTVISPNGNQNASTFPTGQGNLLWTVIPLTVSTTYTVSLYVKLGTATNLCLIINNSFGWNTVGGQSFNSSNGLNTSTWTKINYTFTTPSDLPLGTINFHIGGNSETGLIQSTGTVYIWGAQLEQDSYATSYIPTVASTVTRNADVISKTGISSLIGQTEGTVFVEESALSNSSNIRLLSISNDSTINIIRIGFDALNRLFVECFKNGSQIAYLVADGVSIINLNKACFRYKDNDFSLWVNGVKKAELTTQLSWSGNNLNTLRNDQHNGDNKLEAKVKSIQIYKTYLTDSECIELTTI